MSDYGYKERDFEHPSTLFVLEDSLKILAGYLLFSRYIKAFGLKGNERVLDFGCGGGVGSRCLANLLKKGGHLTCIDISNFWIKRAKRRLRKYDNVDLKAGDIRELDIPDASLDAISTIYVIHDIPPADRRETISTLSQKLKPGGTFFIKEPIKKSHGMSVDEIRSLLSDAGLGEIAHRQTESQYIAKYQKTS